MQQIYSEAWNLTVRHLSVLASPKQRVLSAAVKKRGRSVVLGQLTQELKKKGEDFIDMVQSSAKWEAEFVPLDWVGKHLALRPPEEGGAETTTVNVKELVEFLKG